MKCLINGTGIEEGMYPLTCEIPAGLFSLKKGGKAGENTILDRLIQELEASGEVEGYLLATCERYEKAYESWLEKHSVKEKIKLVIFPENTEEKTLIKACLGAEEQQSDWLVLPHNGAFYVNHILEQWKSREKEESCVVCCGNENTGYELPVFLLKSGKLPEDSQSMGKVYTRRPEKLITNLPDYEYLVACAGGPRIYPEFSIQAYTQERYGNYYISNIHMENTIPGKSSTFAYIRLHNGSEKDLTPGNARIGYRLWLEQTYENSFQVDKIPMAEKEPVALPERIKAGEAVEIPVVIEAPGIYGKYYLQFDLEVNGEWQAKEEEYFCFPCVSFINEASGPFTGAMLATMKKVHLTGVPESANAGEQLEAEAARRFAARILPEHIIQEYSVSRLEDFWNGGGKLLNKDDRIIPYTSGVLGAPAAMGEENFRRRTAPLAIHPKFLVPFVVPPQHMAFPETEDGKEQLGHSAAAYMGANYFVLGGNEEDYSFIRENFCRSNMGKAPRLSFGMDAPELMADGDDFTVVVCGGSKEGFLDSAFKAIDENGYHRMFLNLDYNAYQPGAWFGPESRRFLIDFCYKTIGATKAVVTDTVYGLSFALMCHRPCVVLGCTEEREWFRARSDIFFVDNMEQLEDACKAALKEKGQGPLPASMYADMERFLTL